MSDMQTSKCSCGNTLFFDSSLCVKCNRAAAMCWSCLAVTPVIDFANGSGKCGNSQCKQSLLLCANGREHGVCNRSLDPNDENNTLCSYCQLNETIPDLSVEGNHEKWRRLEAAKRRVLHQLESNGLPIHSEIDPVLRFRFESDAVQPVVTGHADGCITINIREADDAERERLRVQFSEPQRTLVGHFRHELGHYYWELLVKPHRLERYRAVFGDETNPSYETARMNYYESGPAADWQSNYISAYASMHSWEDFAETFAAYLDILAILETSRQFRLCEGPSTKLEPMLNSYRQIGMIVNELNRDMGLIDLVPEVITPAVTEKLQFVHELRSSVGN